jgi:hypothetical protein
MITLVLPAPTRANRSHTREDLLKKENRVNLTLFGAHSIREFWKPLYLLLGIPQCPWLTREVIAGTGNRPDFILNGAGKTPGCIEVELGGPNEQQLQRYRDDGYDPVICIVGRRGGLHGYTSLEEVAALARSVAPGLQETNRPAMEVLGLLADTIDDGLNGFSEHAYVQPIPTHLLELPWFAAAIEPLLSLQRAGYVANRTTSSQSLSLQLERVPCMGGRRLALLTQRHQAAFHLPVPKEMTRVLGGALADVTAAWGDLLQRIMPDWPVHADSNQRVRIEAKVFEQNANEFAVVFALLAARVRVTRL